MFRTSPMPPRASLPGAAPLLGIGRALAAAALLVTVLATLNAPVVLAQPSGPRHALVIGNAAYKTERLDNSVNDARAIGATLRALGFEVMQLEDASRNQMFEAIRRFGDQIKSGSVGLFYYAGHGVQVRGRNFLVPVDSGIEREDEVLYQAIEVSQVLEKMESAKNPINIVILDACRDNPFVRPSRSLNAGLAPLDAPVGTLIAFATAPGAKASDGTGSKHGVYTQHLLTHMKEPSLKVEEVFKRVRAAVRQDTSGRQIPWEHSSLVGDFYFVPRGAGAAAVDEKAMEQQLWGAVQNGGNVSDYRAYLERYPNGEHAAAAQAQAAGSSTSPARRPNEFSFSQAEEAAARERAAKTHDLGKLAQSTCTAAQRRVPIRVDVVEQVNTTLAQRVGRPAGGAPEAIRTQLKTAGLTVGPGGYTLRGTISSQAAPNRLLRVNEVSTNAALELVDASGKLVSNMLLRNDSFAGSDLVFAYQELVARQANEAAGQIIQGHCAK